MDQSSILGVITAVNQSLIIVIEPEPSIAKEFRSSHYSRQLGWPFVKAEPIAIIIEPSTTAVTNSIGASFRVMHVAFAVGAEAIADMQSITSERATAKQSRYRAGSFAEVSTLVLLVIADPWWIVKWFWNGIQIYELYFAR